MYQNKNYNGELNYVSGNFDSTDDFKDKTSIPIEKARLVLGRIAGKLNDTMLKKLIRFYELIGSYIIEKYLAGKFK